LADSSPVTLSLYVHVPFCAAKCRYCDFYSVPVEGDDGFGGTAARVVEETLAQLDRFLENAPEVRFQTVYVGGGTPSILPPTLLRRLLDRLSELKPAEWTVEANPESLDRDFLVRCWDAGVTRISMGLQSMDDRLLSVLGRPGAASDNHRAIDLLVIAWAREVSFDWIAGIPGQTVGGLRADIDSVRGTGAGHASLYSLTVEPGTPLAGLVASGEMVLNPSEHDDELWLAGREALEVSGLRQYEVSNYARPGSPCRHNLRYWHLQPYLGIGPGAVSTLPPGLAAALAGRRFESPVVRLANPRDIAGFLRGGTVPGAGAPRTLPWSIEAELITAREFILETLMMGLRLVDGIARVSIRDRFGLDLDDLAPGLWQRWVERGMAAPGPSRLRLTGRGLLLLDALLRELAVALADSPSPQPEVRWPV
jgi:oxygen-independent coproporphyrinogen III oxidase